MLSQQAYRALREIKETSQCDPSDPGLRELKLAKFVASEASRGHYTCTDRGVAVPQIVTFKCPECGSHRLEEVMTCVQVTTFVTLILENGDCEYGKQTNDDGEIERYQCVDCGFVIPECKTPEELYEALDVVRQANESRKPNTPNDRPWYRKYYHCGNCHCEWTDEHDCLCDDKCPECNTAMQPYDHLQLNPV